MPAQSTAFSLGAISDHLADLIDRLSSRLVIVHGGRRGSSSGILWRPGLIVTAEEALETDENISITRPDGTQAAATLVGRDPSTDIALLRTEEQPLGEIPVGATDAIRTGHFAIAVGRRPEGLSAALGIVALAGAPWRSLRGGHIDRLLHLDLQLDPRSEGAAALDADGRVIGMTVLGPRGRVLVIPSETIERVVPQLLEHGRIARGYLGLGVQPLRIDPAVAQAAGLNEPRGLMIINVDPDGPGQAAKLRQGDVLISWNAQPLRSVRGLHTLLGPESVGQSVELGILRAGERMIVPVQIRERPQA
ncbi:S1C family serine protease [Microvirga sp. 2TAF3]|uniref:S1C family serine protease n=1 Tax=Microvirga sp. 2TAF3 TaxID=3233014 RepID=UPI003F97FE40